MPTIKHVSVFKNSLLKDKGNQKEEVELEKKIPDDMFAVNMEDDKSNVMVKKKKNKKKTRWKPKQVQCK